MRLSEMLRLWCAANKVEYASLAREWGTSRSTVTRFIANERMPNGTTMARVIAWMMTEADSSGDPAGGTMTLNERYRAIYMRLWGFKDFCDEQHNITMRELEKELQASLPEGRKPLDATMDNLYAARLGDVALLSGNPHRQDVGDSIDRGLILVRLLKEKGFDVLLSPQEPKV